MENIKEINWMILKENTSQTDVLMYVWMDGWM